MPTNRKENKAHTDYAHQELLTLLRNAWEDIERTKLFQWGHLYRLLTAQSAVIGFFIFLFQSKLVSTWLHCIFAVAITLLTVAGIAVIEVSQATLDQKRHLVDEYYKMFHDERLKELLFGQAGRSVRRTVLPKLYSAMLVGVWIFALVIMFGLEQ